MARNLVIGTGFYFEIERVRVFVESLRQHYDGEVMILVSSRSGADFVNYLRSKNIRPIFFDCAFWMPIDMQFSRYIRYAEILAEAAEPYDSIMLSDIGDVLFQADPFKNLPAGELLVFLEDDRIRIGQSHQNSTWIEHIYGSEILARLKHECISCSGTTIGNHAAISNYLKLLTWEGRPEKAVKMQRNLRGYDQGMHNVLLHTGALSNARIIPNDQFVWTINNVPDEEIFIDKNGIHTKDGRYPPIIHQYPYKTKTKAWVVEKFGLKGV